MKTALSVTMLNEYIKVLLDRDEVLQSVYVIGEVSNFSKNQFSGHMYFSLKDKKSVISCVMFAQNINKDLIDIKDGIKIYIYGYVSSYVLSGRYQIYVYRILPAGVGEINEALENLKNKLIKEGLFDKSRKKQISKLPTGIGVITSLTGAVIHDIKSVLLRRNPMAKIVLYSVHVQGQKSSNEIINAINNLNLIEEIDVIILGRGGGSIEELWNFNEENVVRAVACSIKPIISAVGHDVDYTLCDMAADLRAATPSAAAELASLDIFDFLNNIKGLYNKLNVLVKNRITENNNDLNLLKINLEKLNPSLKVMNLNSNLITLKSNLKFTILNILALNTEKLNSLKNIFLSYNPKNILKKGYTLLIINNKIIKNPNEIKENQDMKLIFEGYCLKFKATDIKLEENNNFLF